jgi:phosphohistidine swiveling domain-containing protein
MESSASDIGITTRPVSGKAGVLFDLQAAGFRVPEFFCSPPDLAAAVAALGFPLAVRSAASGEDGMLSSFAGQFRTILNLRSLPEVAQAVSDCRESMRTESVAEYCRHNGVDPDSLQMNVIVQRMIEPELAGVAFTVNPVTGAEEVVIEACEGLGDALLAGHRTPLAADHPLLQRYHPEIEAVARRIQRYFGAPQDVEFAVERGTVYVLQARPITRIAFDPAVGEWTNADYRDGGVSSGACTPIMWSLYEHAFQQALVGYLGEMKVLDDEFQAARMFFGRPYWNLGAVKRCLAKLPGFVERRFDEDLAIEVQYLGPGIQTPVNAVTLIRALPAILAIGRLLNRQEAFNREFLGGAFDALERKYEPMAADVDASFRQLIERDYVTTEVNYFRTIFCASLAKLDFTESFPRADYRQLVAALPEMRHLAPTRAIREMARKGEVDVDGLIRRFRHHSRRELDLSAPRWDEDRPFVEQLVANYRGSAGDDPRTAYEGARRQALADLPWHRRGSFERKLDRLRRFVWLREEMRDLSTRLYYQIRRHLLEIARRRGLGDDIFFMTFREIIADDRSRIERNREIFDSYRNFKAPNEIGMRFPFRPVAPRGGLQGIGASQGVVRGVARIARSVEEAARVEKGAILVCPFTDPGWTVTLDRVAGVVTETGGLLSHAAVICREYGIPAVLAVPGATRRIRDGATIAIDGGRGCVEVIEPGRDQAE